MSINDLFLNGHGYTATVNNQSIGSFQIPPGITLYVYCKVDKLFDSAWEDDIVKGKTILPDYVFHSDKGVDRPDIEVLLAGDSVPESILVRPGNMSAVTPFKAMMEIKTGAQNPDTCTIVGALTDKTPLVIKDKANCYAFLSAILDAIATSVGAQDEAVRVHWCACRSHLHVEGRTMTDDEVLEQARTMPRK